MPKLINGEKVDKIVREIMEIYVRASVSGPEGAVIASVIQASNTALMVADYLEQKCLNNSNVDQKDKSPRKMKGMI